ENNVYGRQPRSILATNFRSQLEHQRGSSCTQRIGCATQTSFRGERIAHHFVKHSRCCDFALECCPIDCMLKISRTQIMQEADDFIATKVSSITQRRTPVAGACTARIFMNQVRVFGHELTNDFDIITPYCIDQMTSLSQPRPTSDAVTPRQSKLRISEFNGIRFYPGGFRM